MFRSTNELIFLPRPNPLTWLELIIMAFENLGGKGTYKYRPGIYSTVESLAKANKFRLPAEWQATVRNVIQSHPDVFRQIDRGYWALR